VLIPEGRFWTGSEDGDNDAPNDKKPRHIHYLKLYYLGIYCVTVAKFKGFVAETGHDGGADWKDDPDNHPVGT
jgi:formylglycine-generating enzyme required for sulfatase activity